MAIPLSPISYEPTSSKGASSLDADQQTNQGPTAYLPSYSTVPHSRWWEEAALIVIQTSHDFGDIKQIVKFTPGLNLTTAATLLSSRRKGWLDAFLTVLCRDEAVDKPSCDCLLSTAEAIVEIINSRSLTPPTREWNWDGVCSALISSTDISIVAEELDAQIHSMFCTFAFEDWVAWCHGYQNDAISKFLDTVFNVRNDLAQYSRQDAIMADRLLLLHKASFYSYIRDIYH